MGVRRGSTDYEMKATGRGKARKRTKVQTAATQSGPDFNDAERLVAADMGPRPGTRTVYRGAKQPRTDNRAQVDYDKRVRNVASAAQEMMPTDIDAVGDRDGRRRRKGIAGLQTAMSIRETIG